MKIAIKNTILILGLLGMPALLSATSGSQIADKDFDRTNYPVAEVETLPFPTEREIPGIHQVNVGTLIMVKLTITEEGVPTRIGSTQPRLGFDSVDQGKAVFADQIIDAVAGWTFEPARDSYGNPVAVTVRMPVRVIEHNGTQLTQVGVILDQPSRDLAQL